MADLVSARRESIADAGAAALALGTRELAQFTP
jgi:hypothetical protein